MAADTARLLRYASFGIWGLTGLPLLVRLAQHPALWHAPRYLLWLACFVIFGIALGLTGWREQAGRAGWRQGLSLGLQTLAALAMIRLVCSGQEGALLVIVAAQLGWVLPLSRALAWVAIQTMLMCAVLALAWSGVVSLMLITTFLGFQVLAVVSCFLTAREASARAELTRANRELESTRELLANTTRLAERARISRDLHDTLGHHLTALSLNLEAASHMASGSALTQVQRAQGVTRQLLTDVRGAVSALRGDDAVGLGDALRALVDAVTEPRVHLTVADDVVVDDSLCAQTVLRCVQEIVTNTIRHAQAANLWIEIARQDGELRITARDDGRGAKQVRPGHGLTGMRERLDIVGGRLTIDARLEDGFRLTAAIPLRGGAA